MKLAKYTKAISDCGFEMPYLKIDRGEKEKALRFEGLFHFA